MQAKKRKVKTKKIKRKYLDEKETLSYEQEILDNNRQLARLRTENEKLEEEATRIKEKFQQLEEDRSDIIAYLKRSLENRIEESKELSEKVAVLEELRKDELAAFKKKEDAMQLEYKTMENNLNAEVKLAAGKLNALEDWRIARLDLMNKFEKQEKEMAEQEMRHKEELYEAEKSIVTKKDMMQKEMKEQLQILSERLLKAITLRITEIINRTIRENVALNRDLDKLLETNKKLENINIEHKKVEQILKLKWQVYEKKAEITQNKIVEQRNEMHKIVENFESLLIYYGNAERSNVRLKRLEDILEDKIKENNMLEKKIKKCEKNIMKAKDESERLTKLTIKREKELRSLKIVLNKATAFLNKAIEIVEEVYSNNKCLGPLASEMLHSLMEILQTDTIINIVDYTPSQIDKFECTYLLGSLGLIEPVISSIPVKKEEEEEEEEKSIHIPEEEEPFKPFKGLEQIETLSDISSTISSPKED